MVEESARAAVGVLVVGEAPAGLETTTNVATPTTAARTGPMKARRLESGRPLVGRLLPGRMDVWFGGERYGTFTMNMQAT